MTELADELEEEKVMELLDLPSGLSVVAAIIWELAWKRQLKEHFIFSLMTYFIGWNFVIHLFRQIYENTNAKLKQQMKFK